MILQYVNKMFGSFLYLFLTNVGTIDFSNITYLYFINMFCIFYRNNWARTYPIIESASALSSI